MATLDTKIFEENVEVFFAKFPQIPYSFKEQLVMYGPYLTLIGGILEIFNSGLLNTLNLGLQPFWLNNEIFFGTHYLFIFFSILVGAILILSFKPLMAKKITGWRMLLYADLLYFIVSLIAGDIGGLVLNLVGLYLLFQIRKSYY